MLNARTCFFHLKWGSAIFKSAQRYRYVLKTGQKQKKTHDIKVENQSPSERDDVHVYCKGW